MTSRILMLGSFISAIFFPWPLTAALALLAARAEPFTPLAVGIFADTLYYAPSSGGLPLFTLFGAAATLTALFLRGRLRATARAV